MKKTVIQHAPTRSICGFISHLCRGKKYFQIAPTNCLWVCLGWIILGVGIALRFSEYIAMHSFWSDEAVTAYKLTSFSLKELIQLNGSSFTQDALLIQSDF